MSQTESLSNFRFDEEFKEDVKVFYNRFIELHELLDTNDLYSVGVLLKLLVPSDIYIPGQGMVPVSILRKRVEDGEPVSNDVLKSLRYAQKATELYHRWDRYRRDHENIIRMSQELNEYNERRATQQQN